MELWNEVITDRSWQLLQQLRKSVDFVLIGGWAVYLFTRSMKSKDIDIIVDFESLTKLREFGIRKNDRLKKYEMEFEGIDVDIYIPHYSKLPVPLEEMQRETVLVEGFSLPRPEVLMVLKQQAEMVRKNAVKGQKDRIDMIALLLKTSFDLTFYRQLLEKFGLADYLRHLRRVVSTATEEFEYLGIRNPGEIKKFKKRLLEPIGELRKTDKS